jgi:hypothetical protein
VITYSLLTVIITERRCFNDEDKTNEQCPKHCLSIYKFVVVVIAVSLMTRKKLRSTVSHYVHLDEEST